MMYKIIKILSFIFLTVFVLDLAFNLYVRFIKKYPKFNTLTIEPKKYRFLELLMNNDERLKYQTNYPYFNIENPSWATDSIEIRSDVVDILFFEYHNSGVFAMSKINNKIGLLELDMNPEIEKIKHIKDSINRQEFRADSKLIIYPSKVKDTYFIQTDKGNYLVYCTASNSVIKLLVGDKNNYNFLTKRLECYIKPEDFVLPSTFYYDEKGEINQLF